MGVVPEDILRDIVRRVGKSGFMELGPFIVSGKLGKRVAYEKEFLVDADIDEFIFVPSLAEEGSLYRLFFMKCLEAGNLSAKYVEGLRLAVKYGPSQRSFELMESVAEDNVYAQFAGGVFSICGGQCDAGLATLGTLYRNVNRLGDVVEIADAVMAQITEIGPPLAGNYNATYRYPLVDVPECVQWSCSMDDVCFHCLAYWYSERVRDLC